MTSEKAIQNCKDILDSCWKSMKNNRDDWKKTFDALGSVCERSGNNQRVLDFAVKCTELLELKFKEETNE